MPRRNVIQATSNRFLDILPTLNADHILTTNYSCCTETTEFSDFYPAALADTKQKMAAART